MKISKEKQQHLVLVAIVAVGVILALYFIVIGGQLEQIAKLNKKITEATANVEKGRVALKKEPLILADLNTRTNELVALESTMATGNDKYFWFISTLNRFKVPYQNQIEIPHVSRESVTEVGMYQSFPYKAAAFQLRGVAHYHSFGRFLADFENKFPFFRVQKLTLAPAGADLSDAPEKLSFEMEIVTLINPNSP